MQFKQCLCALVGSIILCVRDTCTARIVDAAEEDLNRSFAVLRLVRYGRLAGLIDTNSPFSPGEEASPSRRRPEDVVRSHIEVKASTAAKKRSWAIPLAGKSVWAALENLTPNLRAYARVSTGSRCCRLVTTFDHPPTISCGLQS